MDAPTIPSQRRDDLIGLDGLDKADLLLFLAGNQFMATPDLLDAFRAAHPGVEHIYCQTLPPGLQLRQILAGKARFDGREITGRADLYVPVSDEAVDELARAGLTEPARCPVYLRNRLALLVAKGNPLGIRSPADLARPGVRLSQPDPELEHIGCHILEMYRRAGGENLVRTIMEDKKADGSTRLTTVHHRETPRRILDGEADAGPVWITEGLHAARQGLDLETVELPEDLDMRDQAAYRACPVSSGRNPENARAFTDFIFSQEARDIFRHFGFLPENRPATPPGP